MLVCSQGARRLQDAFAILLKKTHSESLLHGRSVLVSAETYMISDMGELQTSSLTLLALNLYLSRVSPDGFIRSTRLGSQTVPTRLEASGALPIYTNFVFTSIYIYFQWVEFRDLERSKCLMHTKSLQIIKSSTKSAG